jgi:diguanylate cyclase (GGDEF)-like protein/PAS domain S-box-containing protein
MSVHPLREPCEGTVVMHENITRSKLAEQRLDYERTQLRTLLETIPDLVWLKDAEGHYLTCNAQFERLFGARQADIVGKTDYDFLPAAQADEFRRRDAAAAAAPRPQVNEEWLVYASDGHEALVETTKTAMRDASGTLIGVLGVARDITDRHRMQQQVQQLALSDTLTGLANRRLLGDRVKHAVQASRRSGHTAALMFIDLDKFKALNDAHGHDVGDQVLVEVARRLKSGVREVDTVARFGGDEFVVLLGELDKDPAQAREQAGVLARKILAALALPYVLDIGRDGEKVGTIEHHCTASIGVGLHNGPDTNADELFKRADLAMYQAKLAGRDVVRFFETQDGPAR